VPLHAVTWEGEPVLARNPVCYSPSASIMSACRQRAQGRYTTAVVLGDSRSDLRFARAESQSTAARFGTSALIGSAATPRALDEALRTAGSELDVLHLACHATFAADDVLKSGIQLADLSGDDAMFTARDLVARSLPAELVVLSACDTGRTGVFA